MKVWEENRLKRLWEQAEEQPASALEAQPLEDIALCGRSGIRLHGLV